MKKSLLYLAALAGLTACVQDLTEDTVVNPVKENGPVLTINATMNEAQTRVVTEDGLSFKFQAGDKLGVFFYNENLTTPLSENVPYKAGEADKDGNFDFVLADGGFNVSRFLTQGSTQIFGYAPYVGANGTIGGEGGIVITRSGENLTLTHDFEIPVEQNNATDVKSVAENYTVVAKPASPLKLSDTEYKVDLGFAGIFSLIKFNVLNETSETLKVTEVKFTVGEEEALTGWFTADLELNPKFSESEGYALTPVENKTNNFITMGFDEPYELAPNQKLELYGVVNSGTYAADVKLEVKANSTERDYISYVFSSAAKEDMVITRQQRAVAGIKLSESNGQVQENDKVELINNVEDLKAFAAEVNNGDTKAGKAIVLTSDITLAEEWTPIGPNADDANKFQGTFDGQGHTIFDLKVNQEAGYHAAGLFGVLNGTVKNLVIDGAEISNISSGAATDNGTAVVAGSIYNTGLIQDVTVKNATVNGNRYVAGIAGYVYGKIENCEVIKSSITATCDDLTGSWDNGDKVGGIAGYFPQDSDNYIDNCKVKETVIKGYRDLGGIAGYSTCTVKNCHVEDVTLTVDITNDYKEYDSFEKYDAKAIVGEYAKATLENNTADNVTIKAVGFPVKGGEVYYRTLAEALNAKEAEIELLEAGEYELAADQKILTETLKVTGVSTDARITFANTNEHGGVNNMSGVDATFEKVTIVGSNVDYFGMKHAGNMTYNNCVIENQIFCYSEGEKKSVFNDCKFVQTDAGAYNIWTYASNVDFNGCEFYCAGKAALVYAEGSTEWKTVNFNGCNFTASAEVAGKAAIEIDSSLRPYIVNVTECTAEGFGKGSVSGVSLYNLKKGTYGVNCKLTVNGTLFTRNNEKFYMVPPMEWEMFGAGGYTAYCIDDDNESNNAYIEMTEVESGVYTCEIPTKYERVQFQKKNGQKSDILIIPTDGKNMYVVPDQFGGTFGGWEKR